MKKMNIYTVSSITFVAIMMIVGGYWYYRKNAPDQPATYSNETYGISFAYPSRYQLTETPIESASGTHVTITDKGFRTPRNGEGPTAITVDMFAAPGIRVPHGKSAAEAWIASSTHSNWSVSDMESPGPTRVADKPAWLYTWDGLYRGLSVVTDHKGSIIMFSVTYDGEGDFEKREAFTAMMEGVRFDEATQTTPTE